MLQRNQYMTIQYMWICMRLHNSMNGSLGRGHTTDRKHMNQLENEPLTDSKRTVYAPGESIYDDPKYVDIYEII